ncbi:MAG TPA: toxin-antitoxin system protein [Vicinamibacteria bacterium]|nr:toxin-antitoxin system protein [Vicinamibacteria bacterium]
MLKRLADSTGATMSDLISRAIEEFRRKHFLQGLSEDYRALRARDAEWAEELEERHVWDAASGDDIEES